MMRMRMSSRARLFYSSTTHFSHMSHTPFPHISEFNYILRLFYSSTTHFSHMSHTPFAHISECNPCFTALEGAHHRPLPQGLHWRQDGRQNVAWSHAEQTESDQGCVEEWEEWAQGVFRAARRGDARGDGGERRSVSRELFERIVHRLVHRRDRRHWRSAHARRCAEGGKASADGDADARGVHHR